MRPVPAFHSFVGHRDQVARVRRQIAGAKSRGEPAPSMLVCGPSGVGKTMFAKASAFEFGSSLILAHGSESAVELASKFRTANTGDFVFIDEAQGLVPTAQELLYPVIDDHRLPYAGESAAKTADSPAYVDIEPCTVVVATDQPGKLQNALRKRMQLKIDLGYYSSRVDGGSKWWRGAAESGGTGWVTGLRQKHGVSRVELNSEDVPQSDRRRRRFASCSR